MTELTIDAPAQSDDWINPDTLSTFDREAICAALEAMFAIPADEKRDYRSFPTLQPPEATNMTTHDRFELGQKVITASVINLIEEEKINSMDVLKMLVQHHLGIWGDTNPEDTKENDRAVKTGDRLMSVYNVKGIKFWIITDPAPDFDNPRKRLSTTVLLPEDY